MSDGGDGGIQPDSTLALSDQETQEHAKCRGAHFGCCPPAVASLQNKRSQPSSIKATWLLSKPPEQLADVNAIAVESHIAGIPVLVHPLTEGQQQSGIVNRGFSRAQSDDPEIPQVVQEPVCTVDPPHLIGVAVVWAMASTQVAVESRKRLIVQLTHRYAMPMGPVDEVFRRSKESACTSRGVACLR